jgi:hypothetical protein
MKPKDYEDAKSRKKSYDRDTKDIRRIFGSISSNPIDRKRKEMILKRLKKKNGGA